MEFKLKVGIAGYGVVGKRRRHFIDQHPRLRTVAVSDRLFQETGRFDDGVCFHPTYEGLLAEKLDLLFVCLPNEIAPAATMAGLDHGLHVFCEKPPGRNIEDIVQVIRREREHPGLKLKYGFNHRYHESIRDALAVLHKGELGAVLNLRGIYGKSKIISFDSDWRTKRSVAGGGILLDQGIHLVDLMRLFAGDFAEVHSFISNAFWRHDVEDNAYALMRTSRGVVAMLHSSATQWRHRFNLEIQLEKGALILSGILSGSRSYGAETLTVVYANKEDNGDPKEVTTRYNMDGSWNDEINEFADSILKDTAIDKGSSLEALRTMHLIYRIYCADREWAERFQLKCGLPPDLMPPTNPAGVGL
jgi:predicted dehydrogenase